MSRVVYLVAQQRKPTIDAPESEIADYALKLIECGYAAFQSGDDESALDYLRKGRDQFRRVSTWHVARRPIEILIAAVEAKIELKNGATRQ